MDNIYYTVAHRSQEEIDSFKTRYQTFNTKVIPSIFTSKLQLTVNHFFQSTSWGSSHVIYFVHVKEQSQPLVFRANTGFNSNPEIVMLVEKLITNDVLTIGVPTNNVLYVDISRKDYPFDYQIEEMLQGKDIEDNFSGTQEEYDKLSFELGMLVAKIHTLAYPGFGKFDEAKALKKVLKGSKSTFFDYIITMLSSDLAYLLKVDFIDNKKLNHIKNLFEEHKNIINVSRGVLIHHDLADHNIMFEKNHITGIFDWEACVVGDPVLDLASAPTWKTHYPREEKIIEGYKTITSLPKHFQEKMNIYRLRTVLWKTVYAIRAGILNEHRKQKFYNALSPFGL